MPASQDDYENMARAFTEQEEAVDWNIYNGEEVADYTAWRIAFWERHGFLEEELWEAFSSEFANFTTAGFEKILYNTRKDLLYYLRAHSVYVEVGKGFGIATELSVSLEAWRPWPENAKRPGNDFVPAVLPIYPTSNRKGKMSEIPDPTRPFLLRPKREFIEEQQLLPLLLPLPFGRSRDPSPYEFDQNRRIPLSSIDEQIRQASIQQPHGFSRQLTTLTKLSSNDDKYGGEAAHGFSVAFPIFWDLVRRAEVPQEAFPLAFPTMLKGEALNFYYSHLQGQNYTINQLADITKKQFEGPEYTRRKMIEWNAASLRQEILKDPTKPWLEVFTALSNRIRQTQRGLDPEYQTPNALINKILSAVADVPECGSVHFMSYENVNSLCNNISAALENYDVACKAEKLFPIHQASSFYTDRKYQPSSQTQNRPFAPRSSTFPPSSSAARLKTCYICSKPNCWSNKHTEEEQAEMRRKFQDRYKAKATKPWIQAHLQEYEGLEDSEGDESRSNHLDPEQEGDIHFSESFVCNSEVISDETAKNHYKHLQNLSLRHVLCGYIENIKNPQITKITSTDEILHPQNFIVAGRYTSVFRGVLLDTGASQISTAGYQQAQAYLRDFGGCIETSSSVTARYGIGDATSVGKLTIPTPIGIVTFHVMNAELPFLLCLQDMDKLQVFFNNLQDVVVLKTGAKVPVIRAFGHPFLIWGQTSINYLTEPELRQLHRRFGHPSVNRLISTLERAGHELPEHRDLLQKITKFCEFCQKHSRSPGRFKFSLKDDTYFNYSLVVDVMFIDGSPILHVVDESTAFQAARWLKDMSSRQAWDMLRQCWIDVYIGPPEVIVYDAGTNFNSVEFRENAKSMSIRTKVVPVEAANSVGLVERYHAPLRRAYNIITEELQEQATTRETRLQMAVKAVNDTAGYDGLIPTLLVFGAYPRLSNSDAPSPSTLQRAKAIELAMKELAKIHASRQVSDAIQQRNGPKSDVLDALIGSDVLVWRVHKKRWTGPYKLLAITNRTCRVDKDGTPTDFRSTVVKQLHSPPESQQDSNNPPATPPQPVDETSENKAVEAPIRQSRRERRQSRKAFEANNYVHLTNSPYTTFTSTEFESHDVSHDHLNTTDHPQTAPDLTIFTTSLSDSLPSPNFVESRRKELTGLMDRGVFNICQAHDVPIGTRVFGSRFVDEVKFKGTEKAFEKSRLVVQAFNDSAKRHILTQAPTIMRASQRLILILSLLMGLEIFIRDISQAYTQSKSSLTRNVFIRAPKEMNLDMHTLLQVMLPLYGIPEAGTHWFQTYLKHHLEKLLMLSSTFDVCLLYRTDGSALVGLQTDDSLIAATPEFMKLEESELNRASLLAKPVEKLTANNPISFNGFVIELISRDIVISQAKQVDAIVLLQPDFTKEQYVSQRARGAYVATVSQPEAAFDLSFAAQVTSPTWDDAKLLNSRLSWQKQRKGLRFVHLNQTSLQLIAFVDASFANNNDLSSQIGYVIVLADGDGNANVLHWQSIKCKRVTRSVLASELYALVLGFDIAATLKSSADQIFSGSAQGLSSVPLAIATDSLSLYDCLTKLGTTQEKRLMIDILSIRQSYERREIAEILWIAGDKNPADAMTKSKSCDALQRLVDTNRLDLQAEKWVER